MIIKKNKQEEMENKKKYLHFSMCACHPCVVTRALLYCTVLYCTILYYTILYYTILYYTILYYTILYFDII